MNYPNTANSHLVSAIRKFLWSESTLAPEDNSPDRMVHRKQFLIDAIDGSIEILKNLDGSKRWARIIIMVSYVISVPLSLLIFREFPRMETWLLVPIFIASNAVVRFLMFLSVIFIGKGSSSLLASMFVYVNLFNITINKDSIDGEGAVYKIINNAWKFTSIAVLLLPLITFSLVGYAMISMLLFDTKDIEFQVVLSIFIGYPIIWVTSTYILKKMLSVIKLTALHGLPHSMALPYWYYELCLDFFDNNSKIYMPAGIRAKVEWGLNGNADLSSIVSEQRKYEANFWRSEDKTVLACLQIVLEEFEKNGGKSSEQIDVKWNVDYLLFLKKILNETGDDLRAI